MFPQNIFSYFLQNLHLCNFCNSLPTLSEEMFSISFKKHNKKERGSHDGEYDLLRIQLFTIIVIYIITIISITESEILN